METQENIELYKFRALKSQFQEWHQHFSHLCFKSKHLKLTPRFVKYLLEDGVLMPEEKNTYSDQSSEEDEEVNVDKNDGEKVEGQANKEKFENDDDSERQALIADAKQLRQDIQEFMDQNKQGIFVKLNWSSPRDALWMNPTLQCISCEEIFALLKSSTFITHDISCPFHLKVPGFSADEYYLVMKRWHNLNRGMEFRCFVKKSQGIVGISQRDITAKYEFLIGMKDLISQKISEFYSEKMIQQMEQYCSELNEYVIDLYVDSSPKYKVWLIDINPWIPDLTDSLLFTWSELEQQQEMEIRIIEEDMQIQAQDVHGFKVPMDFEDIGKMNEFIDNMQKQQK